MDIEKRIKEIELRLANIEAALRDNNMWAAHMNDDPLCLEDLKRDFRERGVEAIHEYNRRLQEADYQEAKLNGRYAEAYVYKNRLLRRGYFYNDMFYFRWGDGLRAVSASDTEVQVVQKEKKPQTG